MSFDNFFADLSRLETLLGLPPEFIVGLLEEDDWSFVIKGHAVIETAVTHLLIQRSDARLAAVFERLPFAGGRTGKIAFIEQLKLLPRECLGFVRRFAELRNGLVHGAHAFSFDLSNHVRSLPSGERLALVRQLAAAIGFEDDLEIEAEGESFLLREPKTSFGLAVFGVLAQTLFSIDPEERSRAEAKAATSAGPLVLMILVGLAAGTQGTRDLFLSTRAPAT